MTTSLLACRNGQARLEQRLLRDGQEGLEQRLLRDGEKVGSSSYMIHDAVKCDISPPPPPPNGFTRPISRSWNSGFNAGMGKRAWNSGFSGMGKRSVEEIGGIIIASKSVCCFFSQVFFSYFLDCLSVVLFSDTVCVLCVCVLL